MKKTFRILVPLLLAFAIIFCIIWYLFVYDRAFTRDFLLSQARYFEKEGNHTVAAWFYNKAYAQAGNSDAVALELSDQYRSMGNYTKAEYTLSAAIADGGGAELYVALCKLYVEQDKLLDAVTMLGNIANPEIKAQLDALRPAAPTVAPDPGFYSQYISVVVNADGGTLYVTTDSEYPSVHEDAYSQPITLSVGENTIYALSVAESGLVSPLAIFGYTVGGVIEKVEFADPAMEAEIRDILGVSEEQELYTNDLWTITDFTVPDEAEVYSDLAYLSYLQTLTIQKGAAGQLDCLSSLSNLKTLYIVGTAVSSEELAVISSLHMLENLTLNGCSITSIAGIETLTSLTYLDLGNNTIRNITPLSALQNLQQLYLPHNALTDLTELSGLTSLTALDVSYNSLTSISPISPIQSITWLNAAHNSISDLNGLERLTSLRRLSVAYNSITDVGVLSACTELIELDISNNTIADITALSPLNQLANFDFSYNEVTALPAWSKDCHLVTIDGSYNQLTSIDELSGIAYLNNVFMDYNAELESITSLAKCNMLIQVNVFGTKVKDVDALKAMSVIVNYDPT